MIMDKKGIHLAMWLVVFMVFWFSHSTHEEILEQRKQLKAVFAAINNINVEGIDELQCIAGEVAGIVHTGVFSKSLHRFEPAISCTVEELDKINNHRHGSESFHGKFIAIWVFVTLIYGIYVFFLLISTNKPNENEVTSNG